MKRYYYHGTTEESWNTIQSIGYMKAPIFVFDDAELATLFAERTAEIEDNTPIVLQLDLKDFRLHKDPTAPLIQKAHTVHQDVSVSRIEEI